MNKGKKDTTTQGIINFPKDLRQTRSMLMDNRARSPSKSVETDATTPVVTVTSTESSPIPGEDPPTVEQMIKEKDKEQKKTEDVTASASTHLNLPRDFMKKADTKNDPYTEGEKIEPDKITIKDLLTYKIIPFNHDDDLPNFIHSTSALQYFKVLREILFDWTRSKHHEKSILDSATSDTTPPGLRIKKSLEVIGTWAALRLQALQIFSDAENKLSKAIAKHYKQQIPKLETEFTDIYSSMSKINKDEKDLIRMKLLALKNEWIKQQKDRRETKQNKASEPAKNDQPSTSQDQQANGAQFPWKQKPQRIQQRKKGKGRGKNTLNIA